MWSELVSFLVFPRSVLWFLWALLIYLVIARVARERPISVIALSAALSLIAFGLDQQQVHFSYLGALRFAPFFFVGVFFSSTVMAWAETPRPLVLAMSGLAFLALFLLTYKELVPPSTFGVVRFARSVAGAMLMATFASLVCRIHFLQAFPAWIGRRTLEIYVTHSLALSLMIAMMEPFQPYPLPGLLPLLFTATAVCLSLGLKLVAERMGAQWMYAPPARLKEWIVRSAGTQRSSS
jgi:peptidoglycan/LPS O-acetylase OafA/YrhL